MGSNLVDDFEIMQVREILETLLRESALQNHTWNILIVVLTLCITYHSHNAFCILCCCKLISLTKVGVRFELLFLKLSYFKNFFKAFGNVG